VDDRFRIWRRLIDVLTPGTGKIDLWTKYQRGTVTVETDMTFDNADHPRAAIAGAFDGSTEPWSAALHQGSEPATFTIALDREYYVHRIGLSLAIGRSAGARVLLSDNGQRWSEPVVDIAARTHHALEYVELPQAARARFVRIVADATDCPADVGGQCAILNEIELYGEVDSFENDPIGALPRGYAGSDLVRVALTTDGDSRRVLHLDDTSATEHARVTYAQHSSPTKELSFRLFPRALPGGFLFDVLSEDAASQPITAYHLAVFSDGSLRHWDAASAVWSAVTEPNVVPLGAWTTITVSANLDQAVINVPGQSAVTVVPSTPGSTGLTGHGFASAGTAPIGDDLFIDDVRLVD
jgi:hypothetical protein